MYYSTYYCCNITRTGDDCGMVKYIEIVPLDNFNNCSDVTGVKQEPLSVKVSFALLSLFSLL